jgi:RNA recognition motif-containing protein
MGSMIIDLGSKAGTYLNGEKLKICFPYQIKTGNVLTFGQSTRKHIVKIDYTAVENKFEQEEKTLERELQRLKKLENPNLDKDSMKELLGLVKQDTIYVGNLEYSVTEEDLREFFKGCGKIISIRIPDDYQTRRKKGYAFITFESEAAAKQAKRHSGMLLYNRKIKISIAEKKPEVESRIRRESEERMQKGDKEIVRKDFEERHTHNHHKRKRNHSSSGESDHHNHHNKKKKKNRSRDRSRNSSKSPSKNSEDKDSSNSSKSSSFLSDNEPIPQQHEEVKK